MNKRGDIPITILVLGVLAICGLLMLSFFYSINKSDDVFVSLFLIEKVKSLKEESNFYNKIGVFDGNVVTYRNLDHFNNEFLIEKSTNEIKGRYFVDDKEVLMLEWKFG